MTLGKCCRNKKYIANEVISTTIEMTECMGEVIKSTKYSDWIK